VVSELQRPLDATTLPFRSPTSPHHPQLNPLTNISCCYELCNVAYRDLRNTVRCATVVRQVLCCDMEGGLHDVALLNMLKANI
jgi:hypothetical protein